MSGKIRNQLTITVFTIAIIAFLNGNLFSQKIFKVKYESQADIKVYVVKYESQSDLKVFMVNYESLASNNGLWYSVKYESQADKKVYFVKYESQADLKIYFVKYSSQAGWRDNSKKYLMYFRP